jgi:hypothetical protein
MPVEARFSAPVQTGPRAYPASCTMGTGSFPGIKRPGRGVDHPPPSSAEVKERVELYLYSPLWDFMACSRVNFTLLKLDLCLFRKNERKESGCATRVPLNMQGLKEKGK